MRYKLDDLAKSNLLELKNKFSVIPITHSEVEFSGNYSQSWMSWEPPVLSALYHLPRHINHVTFSGTYHYNTMLYEAETRKVLVPQTGDMSVYEYRTMHIQTVGNILVKYIASLPTTVNHISIKFPAIVHSFDWKWHATSAGVSTEFAAIFKNLSHEVTYFDFPGNFNLNDTSESNSGKIATPTMFAFLPHTVSDLSVGFLDLANVNPDRRQEVLCAIGSHIKTLHLNGNELGKLKQETLLEVLGFLKASLETLSVSENELSLKNRDELFHFFSALPAQLESLLLANNKLSAVKAEDLAYAWSGLSKRLNHIDLGQNGFLLLEIKDLIKILAGLHKGISSIRLCEKNAQGMTGAELSLRLACLPAHITSLSLSGCNFFGLRVTEFAEMVSRLSGSITTLDLSDLNLGSLAPKDLKFLLSKIPSTVTKLIVKRNHLNSMDSDVCKDAFSVLHKKLVELDVRENGIDRLFYRRLNRLMDAFPDIVLVVDQDIGIRNDGSLTRYSGAGYHGLFKPNGRIKHQKQLAQEVFAEVKTTVNEPSKKMNVIFPFVSEKCALETDQLALSKSLIPSRNPNALNDSKVAATYRISVLPETETMLDLSSCDLFGLIKQAELRAVFRQIPQRVTHLKIRGNGNKKPAEYRSDIIDQLGFIPAQVECLDLSGHGFEYATSAELEKLRTSLAPTVKYISLANEKPISPAEQIAKRNWPNSYQQLSNGAGDIMQKARALLNDYTKGDSVLKRVFFLHWDRRNVPGADRLVTLIDNGVINTLEDLMSEFEQMNVNHEAGSLGKRMAFLVQDALKTQVNGLK